MRDANGNFVGEVLNLANTLYVNFITPDQRRFRLTTTIRELRKGIGFQSIGQGVNFESLGCPDTDTAYIGPENAVPNIFHEVALIPDGTGGLVPWVGTSFENPRRRILSTLSGDGSCFNHTIPQNDDFYPAPATRRPPPADFAGDP